MELTIEYLGAGFVYGMFWPRGPFKFGICDEREQIYINELESEIKEDEE